MSDNNPVSHDNTPWSTVTITFSFNDPEGERRLRECLNAPDVMAAVREFEEWLNRQGDDKDKAYAYAIATARDQLFAIFNARGLSPWDE